MKGKQADRKEKAELERLVKPHPDQERHYLLLLVG